MRICRKTFDPVHRECIVAGLTLLTYILATLPALSLGAGNALGTGEFRGMVLVASLVLCAALVTLSTIDLLTFQLPDAITLPLAVAGVVLAWENGALAVIERCLAAAVGFALLSGLALLYRAWRNRSGLGLGDAKLFAVAGAWLGLEALASVLAYAAVAALASVALACARGSSITLSTPIPFGPYLAFAIWLVWLYGPIGIPPE